MKKICILFVFFVCLLNVKAEKNILHQKQFWYGYVLNLKIHNKFILQADLQERQFMRPFKQNQAYFRSTFRTILKPNIDLGFGLGYFNNNVDLSVDYNLFTSEIRPYLEFNAKQPFKYVSLSHRMKLESRFQQNIDGQNVIKGFHFSNMRFRYQFGIDVQLNKPKEDKHSLKLKLADEFFINFGKKITYNTFDQNRLIVGLQYAPIKKIAIEADYINLFQQSSSGSKYYNRNIFRFLIIHNIEIKKKNKNQEPTKN